MDAARKLGTNTIEDIYSLPNGVRAELIDGHIIFPSWTIKAVTALLIGSSRLFLQAVSLWIIL